MAQFYTLEEAARVLGMEPRGAQGQGPATARSAPSWTAAPGSSATADIDELARRRGLGSDPDFSLSDPELSLSKLDIEQPPAERRARSSTSPSSSSAPREPDLGQPSTAIGPAHGLRPRARTSCSTTSRCPAASSSSSTILGMKSGRQAAERLRRPARPRPAQGRQRLRRPARPAHAARPRATRT